MFESLLASGLIVQSLKMIAGRARPYKNLGAFFFYPIDFKNDYNSFPSGHTVVAFTISSVLSERFHNPYLTVALYSLASLTAYQRIYSNKHWFSDTAVAAIIGIGIGETFCHLNETIDKKPQQNNLSILPSFRQNSYGVSLNYSF